MALARSQAWMRWSANSCETYSRAGVGPLDAVRHTLTLAWRSLVQIRHNPMELGDLSLQPLMFVALFAYVFGGAIAGSPKAFLQFGLAGIITQNALFLTMNTGVALNTDITKGVFDRLRGRGARRDRCVDESVTVRPLAR